MSVALLPVKTIFGFAVVFVPMETRTPLLERMLWTLAGQAALLRLQLSTEHLPGARLPGGYALELATDPYLIYTSFTLSLFPHR